MFDLKKSEAKPLTVNDRINQMTVEEKAKLFIYFAYCDDETDEDFYGSVLIPEKFFEGNQCAISETINMLNSPYKEESND